MLLEPLLRGVPARDVDHESTAALPNHCGYPANVQFDKSTSMGTSSPGRWPVLCSATGFLTSRSTSFCTFRSVSLLIPGFALGLLACPPMMPLEAAIQSEGNGPPSGSGLAQKGI